MTAQMPRIPGTHDHQPQVGPSGPVTLTLDGDRPLTADLVGEVAEACRRVEDAGGERLLVIRVRPGAVPLAWPGPADVHLVSRWEKAVRRLEWLPAASLAVIEGDCGGGACELLLATDARLALDTARLRFSVEGQPGWPGMALYRLAHQLGVARARQAVVRGAPIDAVTAAQWGLLDRACADRDALEAATRAAIAELGRLPGPELAVRRRLLLDAGRASFDDALGTHLAACNRELLRRESAVDPSTAATSTVERSGVDRSAGQRLAVEPSAAMTGTAR